MTAILISDGNQAIYKTDVVLTADAAANAIVAIGGNLVGVCENGGSSGDTVALSLSGRWEVAATGTVVVGDLAYFTGTAITATAASNVVFGTVVSGTTGDVQVELNRGVHQGS